MVSSNAETIELYLAELPPAWRAVVERLARRITRTAPERVSSVRYRIPTFDLDGLPWIAVAVQKHGLSFDFVDLDLLEDRRGELEACSVGKSCVRVRKPEDVSFEVLERMIDDAYACWQRGAEMAGHRLAHTMNSGRTKPSAFAAKKPASKPSGAKAARSGKGRRA